MGDVVRRLICQGIERASDCTCTQSEDVGVRQLLGVVCPALAQNENGEWTNQRPRRCWRMSRMRFCAMVVVLLERVIGHSRGTTEPNTSFRGSPIFLGHSDVKTTMIYTHVLGLGAGAVRSPLGALGD